jgi:hypothetical protein
MNFVDKWLNWSAPARDPDDLARDFEPTALSIRHWVGVADRRDGRMEGRSCHTDRTR